MGVGYKLTHVMGELFNRSVGDCNACFASRSWVYADSLDTPAMQHSEPTQYTAVVGEPSLQRFQAIQGTMRVSQGLLHTGKLQRRGGICRVCGEQGFEGSHGLVEPPKSHADQPAGTVPHIGYLNQISSVIKRINGCVQWQQLFCTLLVTLQFIKATHAEECGVP